MSTRSAVSQLVAADTLTGDSQTSAVHGVGGRFFHTLYISYTPGAATGNTLALEFDISPDGGTTWFNFDTPTPITATGTEAQNSVVTYGDHIPTDQIRIRYWETGTPSPYGTLSAWIVSSN